MISINMEKAKQIAHEKRRVARAKEFAPLDIKAIIPSEAAAAEVARQVIRDKYDAMQRNIDSASSIEALKSILPQNNNN